jgi:hypothetical protein
MALISIEKRGGLARCGINPNGIPLESIGRDPIIGFMTNLNTSYPWPA